MSRQVDRQIDRYVHIYIFSSARHKKNRSKTELSNHIWTLKKDKIVPSIKWKILRVISGTPTSKHYRLCLKEKFFIINSIADN